MSCIMGILADYDVLPDIVRSLSAQNYAADRSCGLTIVNEEDQAQSLIKKDWVIYSFSHLTTKEFSGHAGIGFLGSSDTNLEQPIPLRNNAFVSIDATYTTTQTIVETLNSSEDLKKATRDLLNEFQEPFAFVVLVSSRELLVARNNGRMSVTLSGITREFNFNGEIVSLPALFVETYSSTMGLAGRVIHDVDPGEMMAIKKSKSGEYSYESITVNRNADKTRCLQKELFYRLPADYCAGTSITLIRENIGEYLGRKFLESHTIGWRRNWLAITIPNGGGPYLRGFCRASKLPMDPSAVIRSRYHAENVATLPNLSDGTFSVTNAVKNKHVIIIDDGIIEGGQMGIIRNMAIENGAKHTRGAVAARLCSECPFGKGIPRPFEGSNEDLARKVGLEKLVILEREEQIAAINTPRRTYCGDCLRSCE